MDDRMRQMSVEERLTLIQELWDSLQDEVANQPITPAQRSELERRVKAADANPDAGVPWEKVKADALARLRK